MATNLLFGYSCCLIAGIGFAVNYLPVKSCDIGDGIFFSAAMSVGILLVGLVTGMFLTSTPNVEIPAFEPLAAAWWGHVDAGKFDVPIHHPDHRPRPWPHRLGSEQYAHGMGHRLLRAFWSSQRTGCEAAMGPTLLAWCWHLSR